MQKLIGLFIFGALMSVVSHSATAEAYFLKIQQKGASSHKYFLQACSPRTAPCTFMLPVQLKGKGEKNILVLMNFKQSSNQIDLHFYWDKTLLTTNQSQNNYFTLAASTPENKVSSGEIKLYSPLADDKKPDDMPDSKFPKKPIATLKTQITLASE